MGQISKMQLNQELRDELARLGTIGDLIGGIDTFAALPTVNNAGFTGLVKTQIQNHDLLLVADASADGHGMDAIYEAATTSTAGGAVSWTFVINFKQKNWHAELSSNVPAVVGTPPTVSDACYAAYTTSAANVRVLVNGLEETGFTISAAKVLTLTGYTADGWTSGDTVSALYFG